MQEDNIEASVILPIFFSYICHTLNLALNDFIKKNDDLDSLMEKTLIMTKILRSKPIIVHFDLLCPSYCKTRWTNQFDIFIWFLENLDKLEKLFQNATSEIASYLLKIPNVLELLFIYISKF